MIRPASRPASRPAVVVVGAGMAGLTAAWRLTQAGAEVVVLERDQQPGGRVRTVNEQGFLYEAGAGFMTNFYGRTMRLVRDLGLGAELVTIGGGAAVLRGGRLRGAWPQLALLTGGLLRPGEALRLLRLAGPLVRYWPGLDLHAVDQACFADTESVAEYARRRLSPSLLDYLIEPPLGGVLYWTPERTSLGMLLIALRASLSMRQLLTLRGGLGTLPAAMAGKLDVRLDADVRAVRLDGARHEVTVRFGDGDRRERLLADAVVCATPAHVARQLVHGLGPACATFLDTVDYAPTVVAAVAVRRRLPDRPYGLLFPAAESTHLGIASVASASRLPRRAAYGNDLLSLYASGAGGRRLLAAGDRDAIASMLADLRRAGADYDPGGDVLFERVHRWQAAVPEFPAGHLCRLGAFLREAEWPPRLAFAGDYLGGPSIEGAVTSGTRAADRLLTELGLPIPPGSLGHRPSAKQ